jgi:hypothetical protein
MTSADHNAVTRTAAVAIGGRVQVTDQVRVRVGQLWRRRQDGKPFIPAHRVDGSWMDKAGRRRSGELCANYVLIPIADDAAVNRGTVDLVTVAAFADV